MVKSVELQARSDALANLNFDNVKQSARAAGSLPKGRTFSKNFSKPVSPAEHEYVLCQQSPSSDISFGWQEVPAHTRVASRCSSNESEGVHSSSSFASECTDSYDQINVTSEDRHANESVEVEEKSFGVTATNEEHLREGDERVAKSTHLALKSAVSENLGSRNFRKNETLDSVESVSEGHSEELPNPKKLAEDNCKMNKIHDVPMREDSGSDSSDDSVEMPSLLKDEEYGLVKIRSELEIENLTEEEEIWMVQCPISLNPQDLENEKLVFGGTSAFTLQLEDLVKYETKSYVGINKPVSCLLPSREKGSLKAKVLQPEGFMVIMEKVDVPEVKMTPSKPSNIQTPKGLRGRHPLFGYDYKEELEVRTQFASQHRRLLHEDFLMQPKRIKKEKKKKGRDADTCNDRGKWQIHECEQESHNNKDKAKKNKKKHHKEHKKKKKDKHVKNH